MNSITEIPELDVRLLSGFAFSCRPDCGLCCYAEPRVAGSEKARLLQIVPEAEFVARGVDEFLAAHPDGGACRQLVDSRCRAHIARPHPCREYPVSVHVGERLQASLVLSCPGVDLTVLGASSPPSPSSPVLGLADELAAVRERVDRSTARRIEASARRRRKIERRLEEAGRWEDETVVRDRFRRTVPMPSAHDFPVPDPPSASDGVELLPLFFDHRSAPIALSSGLGGWEVSELAPHGGRGRPLAVIPPPERMPSLEGLAATVLSGYLRYWLERDALFGMVHREMMESDAGTVSEWVADELRAIGALVLARADVRAKLARATAGRLSATEVLQGIRACDQDLLDRESWGDRL